MSTQTKRSVALIGAFALVLIGILTWGAFSNEPE